MGSLKERNIKFFIDIRILVILCVCGLTLFAVLKTITKTESTEKDFYWQAKYIWFADERDLSSELKSNEWACFRKKITVNSKKEIEGAIAKIAVDSKYWLYINDELVLREGGLKRGEKPETTYYDEVPLENYLKKGENTISILVWYFGRDSFSHITSPTGSLLFQLQLGDRTIISDGSWKAIQNPAYKKDVPIINLRLSEENIFYDATLEISDWYKKSFDDSAWENAVELGNVTDEEWGELIKRKIPFFQFSKLNGYKNYSEFVSKPLEEDTLLELELPKNIQFTPYFKVDAPKGQTIYITLDEEYNSVGKEHKTTYITKDGIQEFESLAWINGQKVYYYIPKGVRILELGYRETGYEINDYGDFKADDEFYNIFWNKALTTLKVNMRDNYMDCPDRERAQWWGDTSISMEEAVYGLEPNANYLYRKAVNTTLGWKHENILLTISPTNEKNSMHLPIQMLLGIVSMYDYYLYTGETDYLEQIYPSVKDYLYMWQTEPNGLVSYQNGYVLWRWEDSAGNNDYVAAENAWYYYALTKMYDMAIVLDKQTDLQEIEQRINILKNAFNENLYTEKGYKEWQHDKYDVRVNAVAVLSGLADKTKYETIEKVLLENDDATSPFMEKYVLEALCKMGKIEEAQERMKLQYAKMVESDSTTLSEYFDDITGSKNHSWSGGPIILMQKYFAGITPSNPGFTEINIKPNFGSLKTISSKVNTVSGTVKMKANKKSKSIKIELETPVRTRVALEKISGKPKVYIDGWCVYKKGKSKFSTKGQYETEDEKYIYYFVEPGNYKLEVK